MLRSAPAPAAVMLLVCALLASAGPARADAPDDPGALPPGLALRVFVHYPHRNSPRDALIVSDVCADPRAAGCGDFAIARTDTGAPIAWADPTGAGAGIPYFVLAYWSARRSPTLTARGALQAIDASFAMWEAASDAGLNYTRQTTTPKKVTVPKLDGRNVVAWKALQGGALAVTYVSYTRASGAISEFDMLFADAKACRCSEPSMPGGAYADPSNVGRPGTYDVRNIGTHEAGHTIMLEDLYAAGDANLTMYGYGGAAELLKDTLALGDDLGVDAAC